MNVQCASICTYRHVYICPHMCKCTCTQNIHTVYITCECPHVSHKYMYMCVYMCICMYTYAQQLWKLLQHSSRND